MAKKDPAAVDETGVGLIVDEGYAAMLEASINQGLVLRFFTNDRTPARKDTLDKYTEIAPKDFTPERLTPAKWKISPGSPAVGVYPSIEFRFDGFRGQVYGYLITLGKTILGVQRFPSAPYPIVNRGDVIEVDSPRLAIGPRKDQA